MRHLMQGPMQFEQMDHIGGAMKLSTTISLVAAISVTGCSTTQQKTVSSDVALPIAGRYLCLACHSVDKKIVGPSFKDIAAKYRGQDVQQKLFANVRSGGSSGWGIIPMPPFPNIPDNDLEILVRWITQQSSASPNSGDLFDKHSASHKSGDLSDKHDEIMGIYSKSIFEKIVSKPLTEEERKLSDFGEKGLFILVILANGNLESVEVRKSTGSRSADEEMMKRIKSASPFYPPTSPLGKIKNVIINQWFSYPKIISDGIKSN